MRILVYLHDSFGGRGGIAKFNRDLLGALCSHPKVAEVVCLPKVIDPQEPIGTLPAKLDFRTWTANSNARYLAGMLASLTRPSWYDMVICGHLRLMRLMRLTELRRHVSMGLILHGVDAWEPFGGAEVARQLTRLDWFLPVSRFTRDRFCAWSGVPADKARIVYNAVDLAAFTPGPKNPDLVARYGLAGKRVLMGLARLETRERYKGFDEVMEAMPGLLTRHPDLVYLICGDGSDKNRLREKAHALGIGDKVIFTGYLPEHEKADTYRLADVFLLAGWGEGFGIVLLEAMACGVPAIASNLDASAEAVGDGRFGIVVNPRDPADLTRGIDDALGRPHLVPAGLETFSAEALAARVHRLILDPLAERLGK